MKIDKDNKTPLYEPGETPQKLREFYASTAAMGDHKKFNKGYDSIKWNSDKKKCIS